MTLSSAILIPWSLYYQRIYLNTPLTHPSPLFWMYSLIVGSNTTCVFPHPLQAEVPHPLPILDTPSFAVYYVHFTFLVLDSLFFGHIAFWFSSPECVTDCFLFFPPLIGVESQVFFFPPPAGHRIAVKPPTPLLLLSDPLSLLVRTIPLGSFSLTARFFLFGQCQPSP